MTDLDDLRTELDEFAQPKKNKSHSAREERIMAGFEEIQRFVEEHGHPPEHGEDKDIFERLYAVRLDRIRSLEECRTLVGPMDHQGLLDEKAAIQTDPDESIDDETLLAELAGAAGASDLTELRHVRSRAEVRAAEEVANREACEDFDLFKPLFDQVETDLKSGLRKTVRFGQDAGINQGEFFILSGQTVFVAEKGDEFATPQGHPDARLRVVFSNGTESNLLLRSLQRALYKDEAGRRITDADSGPLFSESWEEEDVESGTIYVLRSLSEHPFVAEHRELVHKIGVTGGKVETRLANAPHDATYLLADVEVVATYKLAGINRRKLEALFHRIFAPAQLDLTIQDRFGHPVKPREWFLVPLHVIDEAVKRIQDGSITEVLYDPATAQLKS
ncbi:GIY-YIG nuclease family protein [Guyparkeria hydrothermalis]|uniref:GIY-YIG nuclease family protein n=1 Tax=Guyparkeria hydrothermalis TaxID=923 RepID=UPI002021B15C|nr:GIY-YIG nuclease family protein [Guyparkeria hydrothermalis]MCL7751073.1 GIY-YIG nuclease family protein [Guyparkeria hydrothermalis]